MKIRVEYCTSWGYFGKFSALKEAIEGEFDDCDVVGNPSKPRRGAYEITVINDKEEVVLWSKLQSGGFPSTDVILQRIRDYKENKTVPSLEGDKSESSCILS